MVQAQADRANTIAQPVHSHRCSAIQSKVAIAQLTITIAPPTEEATRGGQGAGMVFARADRSNPLIQTTHRHREDDSIPIAVAQLPVTVITPTEDAANAGYGAGVIEPGADRTDAAAQAAHRYWRWAWRSAAIAKLRNTVVTPTEDAARAG